MTQNNLPCGSLKSLSELTGIAVPHLSAYLSGTRPMSKTRSLKLAQASKQLGYDFTASGWMFNPEKIKHALINQTTPQEEVS